MLSKVIYFFGLKSCIFIFIYKWDNLSVDTEKLQVSDFVIELKEIEWMKFPSILNQVKLSFALDAIFEDESAFICAWRGADSAKTVLYISM